MADLFSSILDQQNVVSAFLESADRIDEMSKSVRMRGIDSCNLRMLEPFGKEVVDQVVDELRRQVRCRPAIETRIPKGDGGFRRIFIYSLIDRVKAKAIERQVLPLFEAIYNPGLYSYRKGRSAHDAVCSVIRRYRKNWSNDFVIRADVADYTDNIQHSLLQEALTRVIPDRKALKLIDLYIGNSVVETAQIQRPTRGLVQGVGLIAQFANVFLSDIDHELSRLVRFYRRVGDDFFLSDPNPSRIRKAWGIFNSRCDALQLSLNAEKSIVGKASQPFDYLGYHFSNGSVNIKQSAVEELISFYQSRLSWTPAPEASKLKILNRILRMNHFEIHRKGVDFIFSHRLTDDLDQVKYCSDKFFWILTRFFFRRFSPAAQRKTRQLTRHLPIVPLTRIHYLLTHGKASYKSMAVPSIG